MMVDEQETPPAAQGVCMTTSARQFATFEAFATRVRSDSSLARQHHDFVYSEVPADWGEEAFERLDRDERPFR